MLVMSPSSCANHMLYLSSNVCTCVCVHADAQTLVLEPTCDAEPLQCCSWQATTPWRLLLAIRDELAQAI